MRGFSLFFLLGIACLGAADETAAQTHSRAPRPPAAAPPAVIAAQPRQALPGASIGGTITLADLGLRDGLQFTELDGRREIFVPAPQTAGIAFTEFLLILDDVSAHEAQRSLQILVNGDVVMALALDGHSKSRAIRIALTAFAAQDGFFKLSFVYSGAATADRCMDGRSVGDSLTIRPESAIAFELPATAPLEVAGTLALMPRNVAVVLPQRPLTGQDLATALTAARSLAASGRSVSFQRGTDALAGLDTEGVLRRWARGLVLIGASSDFSPNLQAPRATVGGPPAGIAAARVAGFPALLLSAADDGRGARLLGSPELNATRSMTATVVGQIGGPPVRAGVIRFDQLGLTPRPVEFAGRADISLTIDARKLPSGSRMSRLLLDVLVAPDGAGAKAVVSVFVNDRLLGSMIAGDGAAAQLDVAIPDGLVGTIATIHALIQRRSAAGECRYAPQAYPAQILGSSALVLERKDSAQDFSDLGSLWTNGLEIWLPREAAGRPLSLLALLSTVVSGLSPASAPITVKLAAGGTAPDPDQPFIAVGDNPPAGATPPVRFDRGRIAIVDHAGRALLDIGGFRSGAVAQLVSAGKQPGLWIKSLAADGALPQPAKLQLERGDVAVIDDIGASLALSTKRDALVSIAYPEQTSWLTIAARLRPWIMGALWVCGSMLFLFGLTRMRRRRGEAGRG